MSQQSALPGLAGPKPTTPTTVYLEVDGKPHPATDCHWLAIETCGCISGVSRAGYRVGDAGRAEIRHSGEDAFLRDRPRVVREYEERTSGTAYKLITNQQYRDTYMDLMKLRCPHTPAWGVAPLPTPDGWAWKTTDGKSERNSFRRHLTPSAAVGTGMESVTAVCGKEARQWRWDDDRYALQDTIPCGKCLKLAPDAAPAPAVVDVPTGDLP